MDRIVKSGLKIDLHIHSVYSKTKDKQKVSYNTVEKLPELVQKLSENNVNMCAITDHDTFAYEMYAALKKYEIEDNSLKKVFPGVEFSVVFDNEGKDALVHVIAIFNDEDEEKIKRISQCLINQSGSINYDKHEAFSEERFLEILRTINLDTILIVHQKNSLTSKKAQKADANYAGEDKFNEFIYTDYFEAYEFRNKRNEIFNKAYIFKNSLEEDLRFITGSDCHNWSVYPNEDIGKSSDFEFTYVKSLPSFRGLVMAMTDYRRIKRMDNFFNPVEKSIDMIELSIDSKSVTIPLSKGINVIIGDNSIGKSLLIHKLTNYYKKDTRLLKKDTINGYNKYLKAQKIDVKTQIDNADIFGFDMQGEVRTKFEQGTINVDRFLKDFFPEPLNVAPYKETISHELNKLYSYMREKFEYDNQYNELGSFTIYDSTGKTMESITFVGHIQKNLKTVHKYEVLISEFETIIKKIDNLLENQLLDISDRELLESSKKNFDSLKEKYTSKNEKCLKENEKRGIVSQTINKFKERYQITITDEQKVVATYKENEERAIKQIVTLVQLFNNNMVYKPGLETTKIQPKTNKVYEYEFNSKCCIEEISNEYILQLVNGQLKKGCSIDYRTITAEQLAEMLPYYEGSSDMVLHEFERRIEEQVNKDLTNKSTIVCKGMDKTQEMSAGFDAQIYFNLLSYENANLGIYIIDQPEDNISQNAIRSYLLDRFKIMGSKRQVIMITHNPQFIVNLDVDNVIYLGKENGEFYVKSGALEYCNDNYNILDIIAEHIEGGLDTLKRRWKRYDKGN